MSDHFRSPSPLEKTWFGQPRGLTVLFLTEMWEKFSFFGMRALLVYYMIKGLGFTQGKASLVYGLYTSMVYFTPIFGGAISDRWLGRRRAVVIGASMMALGHFTMTFPALFYPALGLIALGNGFYLPNLPSQINGLYEVRDPRRGSAYNVYYVGINLGAFMAPLVCGTLGEIYGWHYGFAAAGVGMCLGLAIFLAGGRHLPQEPPRVAPIRPVDDDALPRRGPNPLLVLLAIGLAVVVFRGAYEQLGNTVALWADGDVDRRLGDFLIPASWFQSLNPLLVFLLTPGLVATWTRASKRGREPSPLRKMAMGAMGLAVAYAILAAVTSSTQVAGPHASWLWLALFIGIYTIAELYILPVGLGLFARLAPVRLAATTIAAWFLTSFAGNLLAGALGTFWSRTDHAVFFAMMAGLGLVAAGLLWLLDVPAGAVERAHAATIPGLRSHARPTPTESS